MAIRITLSAKGNHLVFFEATFKDGIAVAGSDKIGVLALENPKKGEATLKKAQEMKWSFGKEEDENGFYPVNRATTEEED